MSRRARGRSGLVLAALLAASCSGGPTGSGGGSRSPVPLLPGASSGAAGRIEVQKLATKPVLTLVAREGDPEPALVVAVATDVGPAATAALSAVVETRVRAAGFEVDARVDRSALRLRALGPAPARVGALLEAVRAAFGQPIAPSSPEAAAAAQRTKALRAAPLDAKELEPISACTGALGLAPGSGDDVTPEALEAARKAALVGPRTAISAVGAESFCRATAKALDAMGAWPEGTPAGDPWPAADVTAAYASAGLDRREARVTIALRTADPRAAVAAAERLAAPESPLVARLAALPHPWRASVVSAAARPRGACVAVTLETSQHPAASPIAASAAIATALARQEMRRELGGPSGPPVAARQILAATDPREAAARAAWWSLAGVAEGEHDRWATALAVPADGLPDGPPRGTLEAAVAPIRATFEAELALAETSAKDDHVERRAAVERGQGELWMLLGTPCGVAEEGTDDAGATALAALAALGSARPSDVSVEPWITPDGVGLFAHAAPHDGEAAAALAKRVADEAARAIAATSPSDAALAGARAATLARIEAAEGPKGAAAEVLLGALAPDHPSWLEPLGVFSRVAATSLEAARLRWQAVGAGPLRGAVLANVDAAQVDAAFGAADAWMVPAAGERTCRVAPALPARAGRYDARLPQGAAAVAQGFVAVPIGTSIADRDAAELLALALEGEGGLLASGVKAAGPWRTTTRVVGGLRAAALVVDVRSAPDAIGAVLADVKAVLAKLSQGAATDADLARAVAAAARREREARTDPRARLVELFAGRPVHVAAPALPAWRTWLASALAEGQLVVVEARP